MRILIIFNLFISVALGSGYSSKYLSDIVGEKNHSSSLGQMSKLEFLLSNINKIDRNYSRLSDRLKRGEIIGLELLIADTTKKNFESRWGHALFRFVDTNRRAANDFVVGYVAQVDTPGLSYFKGLFGGYALVPELRPLRNFHKQYTSLENRHLDRFLFSSNEKLRSSLFNVLSNKWRRYQSNFLSNIHVQKIKSKRKAKKYAQRKNGIFEEILGSYGNTLGYRVFKENKTLKYFPIKFKLKRSKIPEKYTFLRNNCSGAIVKLLRTAGLKFLPRFSFQSFIPIRLDDFLIKHNLIHFKLPKIPTIDSIFNFGEYNFLDLKKMKKEEQSKIILNNLQVAEKEDLFILLDQFNLDVEVELKIIEILESSSPPSYEEVYQIPMQRPSVYRLCSEDSCNMFELNKLEKIQKNRKKRYSKRKSTDFLKRLLMQTHLLESY